MSAVVHFTILFSAIAVLFGASVSVSIWNIPLYLSATVSLLALAAAGYSGFRIRTLFNRGHLRLKALRERRTRATAAAYQFISDRTVELRQPLQGLVSIQDLYRNESAPSETRDFLEIADFCSRFVIRQLERIQFFSELETKPRRLETNTFSLPSCLEAAREMAREQTNLQSTLIQIEAPADLTSEKFQGHEPMIRKILSELLDNALRYSGGQPIQLRVAQDPDHPSRVRFVVADTGPGLSDKQVEYLRSPFRQLTNPWPQAQKGLGFVLIKKILSDLGGTLQIESKKGSGTTLSFLLPESSLQKSQAVAAPLNANNSHLTVLVAGDELISRQVVNGLLKKVGVVPTISRCGRPAVDFYHQAPFDVVFVDLDSPSGAGLMTVAAIRDHAVTLGSKRTHLIGLTSNERSPDLQQLHEAGVTEVLSKPVSLNQIREVLARRGFTPTTHSSLTRPAPSEDALNNLVMLDVEREKRRVKRPASGSYYINFDRLYNSLDENMVLCADMLRQVSRELELDLDRLATAMKDKNRADIKMILNKLYGELTMIRCEAGIKAVQNAEAAAALTGDEAFQNSFEEMSELFEKILAEIDSLVPAEQIAG